MHTFFSTLDKCAHFFCVILQVCTLCFGPICKCAHIIVFLATSVQRFFDDHKKCVHTCLTECSFFLLATQVCTLFLLLAPQIPVPGSGRARALGCIRALYLLTGIPAQPAQPGAPPAPGRGWEYWRGGPLRRAEAVGWKEGGLQSENGGRGR